MKKLFISAIVLAMAGSMMAQEFVSETIVADEEIPSAAKSNWFISAGAGPQVFFGDHDKQRKFGERIV